MKRISRLIMLIGILLTGLLFTQDANAQPGTFLTAKRTVDANGNVTIRKSYVTVLGHERRRVEETNYTDGRIQISETWYHSNGNVNTRSLRRFNDRRRLILDRNQRFNENGGLLEDEAVKYNADGSRERKSYNPVSGLYRIITIPR